MTSELISQTSLQSFAFKEFRWYNSSSLLLEVQCGICRLELPLDVNVSSTAMIPEDIFFTGFIVSNQIPFHEAPIRTQYSHIDAMRNSLVWDYVLTFPVKVRDLSVDSLIVLTAWTPDGRVFGGTNLRLFDDRGCLKRGKQKLMFFFGTKGDANVITSQNFTPGDLYEEYSKWDYKFRNEKCLEKFKMQLATGSNIDVNGNRDSSMDWLDRLLLDRLHYSLGSTAASSNTLDESNHQAESDENNWGCPLEEFDLQTFCFLVVEMPSFAHQVLYEEKTYPSVSAHIPPSSIADINKALSANIIEIEDGLKEFTLVGRPFNPNSLTIIADWDMEGENLAEDLNRRLTHNFRRGAGAIDTSVKPNLDEKAKIDRIVNTIGNMTSDDIELLYRFRYSLTDNRKAITKFFYAVNWEEPNEVAEIPILLIMWKEKAPIDVADALKLLSRERAFEHRFVREYAVETLRSASDEELLTFLLQLVQALRYEPATMINSSTNTNIIQVVDFALENSIVGVNHSNKNAYSTKGMPHSANNLSSKRSKYASPATSTSLAGMASSKFDVNMTGVQNEAGELSPLAKFLVDRACSSPIIANYLYWYLSVELKDEQPATLFQNVFDAFIVQLSISSEEGKAQSQRIMAMDDYLSNIGTCHCNARLLGKRKEGKEKILIKLLEEKGLEKVQSVDWVPMPLNPSIKLCGLITSSASMFSSALYPCVIEFKEAVMKETSTSHAATNDSNTTIIEPDLNKENKTHKIMFKSGDDLRQDQLIMQMISLMDRLLKKVNLDMKLLTYGILALGPKDGIMEFVRNSMPISAILKNHQSIQNYLRFHQPDKNGPFEISPIAFDTFVKSCAGSCVVTYILGIGDRHLDNIMMKTTGQMFHIDFGFIFGQDPKPLPPPFRFTREMATAMGGEDSEHYARFKTYCCQCFNWLRKSAGLILNLLSLMGDAGIKDISKTSELPQVLKKVEEKFRLDLSDEQAEQYFIGLINESLHALAPRILEVAHQFAVSMR